MARLFISIEGSPNFAVLIVPLTSRGRMGRRMFPAKIYIGQITIVFGIVVASTWGATQWTAAALGFQQRLGEPWFAIAGYPRLFSFLSRRCPDR
ncbi:hypothetical protein AOQ73_14660 [Bradyrhizobium pachyrhizi]|uniref:hypothetical protein n=1 Tax=Bradyrhizobium TaxID=374 RepID=UPI000704EDEA|nr:MULTISPECIES: hypothetical protein [Bradyrhizobium]KRQ05813.1 hypothetical protein AOQ73_14660 [Bradyrhizobium pachyrhizi]NLS71614.1 hypothetical protein [Bradyrhizobium brasilense]